jgi:hypothetical protein
MTGFFLSDLHLFSRRSIEQQHWEQYADSIAAAKCIGLGGDMFDFRWRQLGALFHDEVPIGQLSNLLYAAVLRTRLHGIVPRVRHRRTQTCCTLLEYLRQCDIALLPKVRNIYFRQATTPLRMDCKCIRQLNPHSSLRNSVFPNAKSFAMHFELATPWWKTCDYQFKHADWRDR